MGSTVIIGHAVGAGNMRDAEAAIGNTVTLFMAVSLGFTAVLVAAVRPLVGLIGVPAEAVPGTVQYLTICFIGIPFITAYNIISSIFRGLGDSKSPMIFIAVACAANIALDYIFIGAMGLGPAGAALGLPLDEVDKQIYFVEPDAALSPIACAYIRARGADRLCSYGDWAALSDECDAATAEYLKGEVSDGIIAPGYDADALEVLKSKKKGGYAIVQIDADYEPKPLETRTVFGVTFEQGRQDLDRIPDQQDHPDRPGIRAPTCRSLYGRHPLLPAAPCELRIRSARSSMPLRHCRTTDRAYPAQSCSCRRCAAGMYVPR